MGGRQGQGTLLMLNRATVYSYTPWVANYLLVGLRKKLPI